MKTSATSCATLSTCMKGADCCAATISGESKTAAAPQQPRLAPQQPAAAPQQPRLAPQQPAVAPQQPRLAPQQPAVAVEHHRAQQAPQETQQTQTAPREAMLRLGQHRHSW